MLNNAERKPDAMRRVFLICQVAEEISAGLKKLLNIKSKQGSSPKVGS